MFPHFVEALSTLPYRVVWKIEIDLARKYNNIMAAKWLPQQSILGNAVRARATSLTGVPRFPYLSRVSKLRNPRNWIFSFVAHPNIKLFIYQGGLQSTEETVYYEVPVVGYPILWDQTFQVQNMVKWGVGIRLRHDTLSKQTIHAAVNEVIGNKRYRRTRFKI